VAAPRRRFIDPRRHRVRQARGTRVGVSVGLEDDDGVGRGALGYGGVPARLGDSAATGRDGDGAGRVVVARREPLTPPLLPLASRDAAGGGDGGRGGGRGSGARGDGGGRDSGSGSSSGGGGGGGARGEAEPSGRA